MASSSAPSGRATDGHSLDRSALSGAAWSGAAKWSTQLLAWAGTIVVARILDPGDFGLLTMASVFMGIVGILSEFGIGTAVITLRDLPPGEIAQLNALSVALGLAGTLLTLLLAIPLGYFFRTPELPAVLAVVGVGFLLTSLQTVPAALLRRELAFRTIAIIDVTRGVLVPLITLGGALLGLRYWALAVGTLSSAAITSVMTLVQRREAYAWPRLRGLLPALTFSRHILGGRVAWMVYQDGDFAVAGRRLGKAALGDYSLAWTLATSPIEKVTMVLADVTPSLFSAAQHDQAALRRLFLNLTELICLATFPASIGLALVSPDLVRVALGPKWAGAAAPLSLLALYAGARSVTTLFGHLLNATRQTRFAMWSSIGLAALLVAGFLVGSRWGPTGIAAAWLLVHPGFSVYSFTRIRRSLDVTGRAYLRTLRFGLDGSLAMAAVLWVFLHSPAAPAGAAVRLAGAIVLGAAVFVGTTLLLHGRRLREILAWLRRIRAGEAMPA